MFFTNLISLGVLFAITCCVAEETPLFPTTDLHDTSLFSDGSLFRDGENLDGSLQADPFESSMIALDNADNGIPSIYADSDQGCSTTTGQLSRRLRARGGAAGACDVPEGSRDNIDPSSGLLAPSISPKVAPFIDIETMELQQICRQYTTVYTVAVCSSGLNGDVVLYQSDDNFDLYWAQKSKQS